MEKKRELNFELLRIVSMFLIVVFHYHDWGGIINIETPIINKLFGEFISIGGNLGVNVFVLISGYFLINSKFKSKKLFKIILEVLFYSVGIYILCVIFNISEFNIKSLIKSLLPISYNMYWFATCYVGMYLLSPIVNLTIRNMNRKQHRNLLILLFIMLSVIPTFIVKAVPFSSELFWFIFLYLIAGYIKRYNIDIKNNYKLFCIIILITVFMFSTSVVLTKMNISNPIYLSQKNSVTMLFLSISLFMFFKNLKIKDNKVIPFFAKATFGVYLIHINESIRVYLFSNILKIQNFYQSNLFVLIGYVFGTALIIYLVCTLIDTIRRKLLEEPLFKIKLVDKCFEKIDNFMLFEDEIKS